MTVGERVNMTPKEKAKKLVDRYYIQVSNANPLEDILVYGKKCALICVDEILDAVTTIADKRFDFYTEVKQEINKL